MQGKQPKKQFYQSAKKSSTCTVDLGFLVIRHGEFIHIDAQNGQAVEIRMDDNGQIGICITNEIAIATFSEIYGDN